MSEIIRLEPKAANNCFGCGGANESGMHLTFDLHVDEAKGKISKLTEELAVTAELSVEYRMPVPLTEEILVEGWQESEKGRNRFRIGEIKDAAGNLLARGRGRFVVVGQRPAS